MRLSRSLFASALLVTLAGACTDPPIDEDVFPPKGIMSGTVSYMGPLPCSKGGHVVGNAILTLFNENALPPPTGLGLSAHRLVVVPGDVLFAGVAHMIPKSTTGDLECPPEGVNVQVSAPWVIGPVDPGVYQIRAFFDYDGDWHAAFKFANMVTKGDVAGGAIANISEALTGGPVKYQGIEVGHRREDGTYFIPEDGYLAQNVAVLLAARVPINRPYFHVSEMRVGGDANGVPPTIPLPTDDQMTMPADYRLHNADPMKVHDSLYWFRFQAGLPEAEVPAASTDPFLFRLGDPFLVQRYDANKDGVIDNKDHITGTTLPVTALGPVISLTKLDRENDPSNLWRITQNVPRVLTSLVVTSPNMTTLALGLMGAVCSGSQTCVAGKCCTDATGTDCLPDKECFDVPVPLDSIRGYMRPSAVCIENAADPKSKTIIVTPHEFDQQDPPKPVVSDVEATRNDIAEQLSRHIDGVEFVYGCLPPGKFALNVIYPSTGQAWSIPNESGICMPGENPGDMTCGSRDRLESQFRTVDIAPASDPAYCNSLRERLDEYDPIREYCLTPKERAAYINGTLWGGDPDPL